MTTSLQHQGWIHMRVFGTPLASAFILLMTVVATHPAQAQVQLRANQKNHPPNFKTFTVLYNFTGGADGGTPYGPMTLFYRIGYLHYATSIYGTTSQGGASNFGTVFAVTPNAKTETVLHSFSSTDGANPVASLTPGPGWFSGCFNGCPPRILFGSTDAGGSLGFGTLFQIDVSSNAWTVLHNFTQSDGASPKAGMVRTIGSNPANLYGTTEAGGANGFGTVFNLDPSGTLTTLHEFAGGTTDGAYPFGTLALHAGRSVSGNILYGTTEGGGASGAGTVFALNRVTGAYKILWNFTGGADGANPYGNLVLDRENNVYGTTQAGGAHGLGTVFKVTGKGVETVIYSFAGGTDGATPLGGLVFGGSGFLGTTQAGGAHGGGTIFEVSSGGVETVLHSFDCATDGCNPTAGLVVVIHDGPHNRGKMFGTTFKGGTGGFGTVFQLKPN